MSVRGFNVVSSSRISAGSIGLGIRILEVPGSNFYGLVAVVLGCFCGRLHSLE